MGEVADTLRAVAAVLKRHGNRGSTYCSCGDRPPTLTPHGYRLGRHRGFAAWHRQHIAEQLAAAGLLRLLTNIAVDYGYRLPSDDPDDVQLATLDAARWHVEHDDAVLYIRTAVGPWRRLEP